MYFFKLVNPIFMHWIKDLSAVIDVITSKSPQQIDTTLSLRYKTIVNSPGPWSPMQKALLVYIVTVWYGLTDGLQTVGLHSTRTRHSPLASLHQYMC